MNQKNLIRSLIILACLLFVIFTVFSFRAEIKGQPLPVYGQVYNFELIDVNGQPFNMRKLKDKIWVVNFFFTTCSTICPVMGKNMAALYRSYKLEDDVDFVSVTVNPEQDTPSTLKEYAKKFQDDFTKWHFLTGNRQNITDLTLKSFKIGDVGEPIFHSAKFVLVDRQYQIRGYYEGTDTTDIQRLFKDIAKLLKEPH